MCELHFTPADYERDTSYFDERSGRRTTAKLDVPRLKKDAVPSQLPNCPTYLSSAVQKRESPDTRKTRIEENALGKAIANSILDDDYHRKSRLFSSINELKDKLGFLDTSYWSTVQQDGSLLICRIDQSPCPKILQSLIIAGNCNIKVFVNDVQVHRLGKYKVPSAINDINDIDILLNHLRMVDAKQNEKRQNSIVTVIQLVLSLLYLIQDESYKYFSVLKFISEQLHLMTCKLEYSPELLIFSSLFYNCSPHGYRFLREKNFLILPSHSTIRRILISKTFAPESEHKPVNFLSYTKNKSKCLEANDKTIILMVDEIHLKAQMDYKGGNIVGAAFNSTEAATSAFVFMISSILSKFKDVVHILPVKSMTAETLHDILKKVIVGLEEIGFLVICVITDNNAINGKALSLFANPPKLSIVYPHPVDCKRPLFFLFDSVHLLKCIRNNWLNQKDAQKTMTFPEFSWDSQIYDSSTTSYAPFTSIQRLYGLESDKLLKQSYKLSLKAVSPSTLDRQNVKYALQIFNEYVIQALLTIGKKHCLLFYSSVASYIKVMYTWWTVMNVQTPVKGIHTRNKYAAPLTDKEDDENLVFLKNFYQWLEVWNKMEGKGGKLTRETFTALRHTTHGIIEITRYCIQELKMKYILTAKFQTDKLESRFGQYRQLAGGNYNISIRQVYECEKKLRVMSVLEKSLTVNNKKIFLKEFDINWHGMDHCFLTDTDQFNINVLESDIDNCKESDVLPIIVYLAGYCCYAAFKKMKCNFCKDILTFSNDDMPESHSYTEEINRGALMHPDVVATNIVMYNYIVINKLTQNSHFHQLTNQRTVATTITLKVLADHDALFPVDLCESGHRTEELESKIVWAATNTLLNNYCSKENNSLIANKIGNSEKKRKLETLNNPRKK